MQTQRPATTGHEPGERSCGRDAAIGKALRDLFTLRANVVSLIVQDDRALSTQHDALDTYMDDIVR